MENNSPLNNNNEILSDLDKKPEFILGKKKLLVLFFGLVIFFIILPYLFLSAPNNFPEGNIISIEKGESLRKLSFSLKGKHLIRSRVSFEAFVILYGGEKHIAPGDYLFENKLSTFEIARRIVTRDRHLASIKITIPEGFTVSQISDVVATKLKNFNKEKFLKEAKEGYLFPDTYFFFSTDTEDDVIRFMSENFEKKMKPLATKILSSGKTENEIIVMASLVEKEANGDTDRAFISGILWNRLEKKMPLQVDSAMETYRAKGLPKNPICNPGLKAIKASLEPKNSPFLYYLHDANGEIHYARNFEEHKKNKSRYLK